MICTRCGCPIVIGPGGCGCPRPAPEPEPPSVVTLAAVREAWRERTPEPSRKLWTDGVDTYIASSAAHAGELWRERGGLPWGDDPAEARWGEVPADMEVEVAVDAGQGAPSTFTATASWWAQLPAGFLCSEF